MAFPLDDVMLGPADFGRRSGTEGIIWHTTEAADTSRASAVATARWQLTNPGSYNWIIYDGGLLLTVPPQNASGGVNPSSLSWAPERYPFLRQSLSLAAYNNPNAHLLNVAFSGKTSVFRLGGMPQNMIDTAAALTRWVEAQAWSSRTLMHCGHMHWQTNRTDPSQVVLDRIAATYSGDDMDWVSRMKPLPPYLCTTDPDSMTRNAPSLTSSAKFLHASPVELTVVGEVAGDSVNGSTRWLCYQSNTWGLGCTHESNEASRKELAGGFTQADLDAAKAEGVKVGSINIKTKAVVEGEAHLTRLKALA